jgi:transcriptional regulator with XRE-family HTH domain
MPSSQNSARALVELGYTQKRIAADLGVSDRAVRQILSGEKPYRNREGQLETLLRGERVQDPDAARRRTSTGAVARTREPEIAGIRGRTRGRRDILRTIRRAADSGEQVAIRVYAVDIDGVSGRRQTPAAGVIDLFDKGYDAGRALRAIDRTGEPDVGNALLRLAEQRPDVQRARGFQGAEVIRDV